MRYKLSLSSHFLLLITLIIPLSGQTQVETTDYAAYRMSHVLKNTLNSMLQFSSMIDFEFLKEKGQIQHFKITPDEMITAINDALFTANASTMSCIYKKDLVNLLKLMDFEEKCLEEMDYTTCQYN